jgi:3-hydroxyisobutyrate dehydrogenase-like beta-hydroxyacid dehydrogenase
VSAQEAAGAKGVRAPEEVVAGASTVITMLAKASSADGR